MDHEQLEEAIPKPVRKRTSKGMPREQMLTEFPSLSALSAPATTATRKAWVAVFNARPEAMHRLLADYIKQVHAQPGRIGQRPMPKEQEVDFEGLVYGEDNEDPITVCLPKLMRQKQLGARSMADRLPSVSRSQLQRIISGSYDPTVEELRQIALALRKPPVFFIEYRKAMAVAALLNLMDERPGIATALYRSYLEVRVGDR